MGQTVCSSCSQNLNENEMPRVCVANGMDTGPSPDCITEISPLESMFIHLAMCYQTILKLSPMGAKIPYNVRMSSLKGFAVHIAAPIDVTMKELFEERPSRVVDPTNFIVLHGIPKKDRTVWQKIVRVDKIHVALTWLKENNPLYANISIPSNPIDVLPEDEPNLTQNTHVNDANAGTQATDDLVDESDGESCKNGADMKHGTHRPPHNKNMSDSDCSLPDFNLDGSERDLPRHDSMNCTQYANDDLVDGYDVKSGNRGNISDSDDSLPQFDMNTENASTEDIEATGSLPDIDLDEEELTGAPKRRRRCISGGNNLIPTDGKENSSLAKAVNQFKQSTNLCEEKISTMKNMPTRKKLKYLIIQSTLKLCRMLIVSGRLCKNCNKNVRSQRSEFGTLLGSCKTLINFEFPDLASLIQIVLRFEETWWNCSLNSEYKGHICVISSSVTTKSKANEGNDIKLQSNMKNADFMKIVVEVMQKKCKYLKAVDDLREDNLLCDDCFVRQDRICKGKKNQSEKVILNLRKKVKELDQDLNTLQSVALKAKRKNPDCCIFCSKKNRSQFRRCKKTDKGLSEYSRTILQNHNKYFNDNGLANHIPELVMENEDKYYAHKENTLRENILNLKKLKEITISIFDNGLLCNSLQCRKGPHDLLALVNKLLKSKMMNVPSISVRLVKQIRGGKNYFIE